MGRGELQGGETITSLGCTHPTTTLILETYILIPHLLHPHTNTNIALLLWYCPSTIPQYNAPKTHQFLPGVVSLVAAHSPTWYQIDTHSYTRPSKHRVQ